MLTDKINHYLQTLGRSQNTVKAYRNALSQFIQVVGDEAELSEDTYVEFLRAIKNLSPQTQKQYKTAVAKLFGFYRVCDPYILKDLASHYLKRGKLQTIPPFDRDAIEKVIDHCSKLRGSMENLRDRAFVLTLADTGYRIDEACSLKRGDIDWREQKSVIIGKGEKQAVIRYSNRAVTALKDYLVERGKIETPIPMNQQPLFARHDISASKKIKPIRPVGMRKSIQKRMEEAGVKKFRIHDFRHYFITIVYASTQDVLKTKELGRHSTVSMTERYTHLIGKLDEDYDEIFNR